MWKIRLIKFFIAGGLLLCACGTSQPQIVTVEVTRIVPQKAVVTAVPSPGLMMEIEPGVGLQIPRTMHTATRLNDNRILLVGGSNGADEQYTLADIFNPATGKLSQVASLNTPRHDHSATLLRDNRVLVVGGYNSRQQWVQDAEVYDPSANTWTVVPPIYPHGVEHTATLLQDGRVLVVGGCIGSGVCTNRVEVFDPQTNSWTEAAQLAAYRASHTAVLLDDGRVLVAGGGGPNGAPADGDALLYDPLRNTWTATGPMVRGRTQARMVKLLDGRVLVAGGLQNSGDLNALNSAEIYNPATNTWTAAASLARPRYAFLLALLPDGRVMALGGAREYDYPVNYPSGHPWRASSFVRQIETYDPRADRWYLTGKLPQPVTYAAGAFLPDGRFWLTGGGAGHAISTAWAETWLIDPSSTHP